MMYLALTYDHRLLDGKDAVTFLRSIKENVEDPRRLVIDQIQLRMLVVQRNLLNNRSCDHLFEEVLQF